jgi:L-asparaginase / beta-aspartyl-peptidase
MTSPQASCLRAALQVGYSWLDRGSSALLAVEQTIRVLERSGLFNAGNGSKLQLDGIQRMDASIMEGSQGFSAGAVASIEGIIHPITAARFVIENTDLMCCLWARLAGRSSPVTSNLSVTIFEGSRNRSFLWNRDA